MSKSPYMPLFCDAYLADTMHLSLEEHGAYLKILMVTWRNDGKALPDDAARMARVLGVTVARWVDKLRPALEPFFDLSNGTWFQKRLANEWEFASKFRASQSEKGKKGGRPNSLKINETDKAAAFAGLKPEESPQPNTNTHPYGFVLERGGFSPPPPPDPAASHDRVEVDPPAEQTAGVQPVGKRRQPIPKSTRLPPEWTLPPDWLAWSLTEGLTARVAEREGEKFRDFWLGKSGADGRKNDWFATWRNWVRRSVDMGAKNGRRNDTSPASSGNGFLELRRKLGYDLGGSDGIHARWEPADDLDAAFGGFH